MKAVGSMPGMMPEETAVAAPDVEVDEEVPLVAALGAPEFADVPE